MQPTFIIVLTSLSTPPSLEWEYNVYHRDGCLWRHRCSRLRRGINGDYQLSWFVLDVSMRECDGGGGDEMICWSEGVGVTMLVLLGIHAITLVSHDNTLQNCSQNHNFTTRHVTHTKQQPPPPPPLHHNRQQPILENVCIIEKSKIPCSRPLFFTWPEGRARRSPSK